MSQLSWLLIATHVPASGIGGGMVRYAVEFARALDKRDDVELSVLTSAPAKSFFEGLLRRPDRVLHMPGLPVSARTALERVGVPRPVFGGFDVVHGAKHVLPRRSTATKVLTVHDMLPIDRPFDFGVLKRNLLTRPYLASLHEADVLVCVSRATQARLRRYLPEISGRTTAVPLAMSTGLRSAEPVAIESLRGRTFALVVGDSSPRKNLGFVIDLWQQVAMSRPGTVLAVVGPPSWGPSDLGNARETLVEQNVLKMVGHVPDAQLRWCYENARVVLCPSKLEGFGLPALEARSFGAPLITSLDPALCEASGPSAVHVASDDTQGWIAAILAALDAPRENVPSTSIREWSEVADETVAAVTGRSRRG